MSLFKPCSFKSLIRYVILQLYKRLYHDIFSSKGLKHKMQHNLFSKVVLMPVILFTGFFGFGGDMQSEASVLRLKVVYNNVPFDPNLRTSWGFSCLIEGMEQTILFDTGGNGRILFGNMKRMHIDPMSVGMVFLSHIHADHTGGLEDFLKQNPHITVCLPESFPISFQKAITSCGANVKAVGNPIRIFDKVYSSGEMGDWIKEQALVLETSNGLVIITGCAHPGIVNIVRKTRERFKDDVYLVMGGFHLGGKTNAQIQEVIHSFKELGVEKVAPSHCTGEKAMVLFRENWGENFLEGGAGAIIEVAR